MTDLLPCPFCGGEANTVLKGSDDWHIECHDCASRSGIYGIRESAIAAWNTRTYYHGYEQAAIEAWENIKAWNTRAERTCKNEKGYCSECNAIMYDVPNYCPNCGSKVKQ